MLQLQRLLGPDERLSHVVVMGMGEPLLNLDRLLPALADAAAPDGLGISARRITISTVGLPEGIRRLAGENIQYHLAISLHAADDELRNQLVPANRGVGVVALMAAADEYFDKTGRRVTFEYVLLGGVNDRPEHARQLIALAARPAGAGERDPLQSGAGIALPRRGDWSPSGLRPRSRWRTDRPRPPPQGSDD